MKLKYILLLFIIFTSTQLFSQNQIIFQQSQKQSILINEMYAQMTGSNEVRNILNILNTNNTKAYNKAEYSLGLYYDIRLIQTYQNNYNATLRLTNIANEGEVLVDGFSVSNNLIPDMFTFDIQLIMPNGSIRTQTHYDNIKPNMDGTLVNVNFMDTLYLAGYALRIVNLKLGYTYIIRQNLEKRIKLIKTYKSINPSEYNNNLKRQNWINIDSLESLQKIYTNSKIFYKEIVAENLQQLGSDPDGKLNQLNELKYTLEQCNQQLTDMSSHAPSLYYQKGLENIKNNNILMAEKYFLKCNNNQNTFFPPALLQLAKVDYMNNKLDSASTKLLKVKPSITDSLKPEMQTLANNVFNGFQANISKSIVQKQYVSALSTLESSNSICTAFQLQGCDVQINKNKKTIIESTYSQYLSEANTNYLAKNYTVAEEKTNAALKLTTDYPREISNPKLASDLYSKIKQSQYDAYIENGKKMSKNAYGDENALAEFKKAKDIQDKNLVKTNPTLPSLIKTSAKNIYIKKLNAIKTNLATSKLSDSKVQFNTVSQEINSYELTSDVDIKKLMNELNQKLGNKECEEANIAVNDILKTAKELENKNDFTAAFVQYQKASSLIQSNKNCNIDSNNIYKQKQLITPCVTYEKMLSDAQQEVSKTNYSKAIEWLDKASELYTTSKLETFNKPALNREEWTINQTNDIYFRYQIADYYYKQKDYTASLRLVKSAIDAGMNYKLTEDLQQKLGKSLANKDHASKTNSPKVWVLSYISGNEKKLKYFKSEYLKQWKLLEKNK